MRGHSLVRERIVSDADALSEELAVLRGIAEEELRCSSRA